MFDLKHDYQFHRVNRNVSIRRIVSTSLKVVLLFAHFFQNIKHYMISIIIIFLTLQLYLNVMMHNNRKRHLITNSRLHIWCNSDVFYISRHLRHIHQNHEMPKVFCVKYVCRQHDSYRVTLYSIRNGSIKIILLMASLSSFNHSKRPTTEYFASSQRLVNIKYYVILKDCVTLTLIKVKMFSICNGVIRWLVVHEHFWLALAVFHI